MKMSLKENCYYFFRYEGVAEDKNLTKRVKSQEFELETEQHREYCRLVKAVKT